MTVLGDSPTYLMNALGSNMLDMMGGQDYPIILGLVMFCILAYLALSYRLDRGALAFLGLIGTGILVQTNAIDIWVFVVIVILVGVVGAFGVLNSLRQGAA